MFKNIKKIEFNLINLIVLGSYYVFCLLLFLSLTGLFKKEFIILGLVAGFLFLLVVSLSNHCPFWKRIAFKKHYLYFFILVPLFFIGILLFTGTFAGDAVYYWLPWAREIVLEQKMPDFLLSSSGWLTSRMPLMPLFFAGVFSFFGFKAGLATILPLFFAAATIFLLFQWLREKGINKKYIFFGALLVLANPIAIQYGGSLLQGAFVLFFFTAFFYYLEKQQKTNDQFYFFLMLLSFALAIASKMTGLILILPLAWLIIKNRSFKKGLFYLSLASFPLIIWFVRNYIIYDNPVFPFLNNLFKGPYYELALTTSQILQQAYPPFWDNILARFTMTIPDVFLLFCPFIILSFYGFWKKRKIQYFLLFFIFLLTILLVVATPNYYRYLIPFLGLLVIYALVGLEKIKSRVFLSSLFFINLWGLLSTKVTFSQSQFLSPLEQKLAIFSQISQFIYDYGLILAAAFGFFFYFFISQKRYSKYLLLLLICSYLVKSSVVQIGSWLNIWLLILFLIFVILIWRFLIKLKEEILQKLVIAFIIILLILNSWGLASLYFLAHGQIAFPNPREAYVDSPQIAKEIERLEGEHRDFYVCTFSSPGYLAWYHNYKAVKYNGLAFYVITDLKYSEDLSAEEIHDLFQESQIKYIAGNSKREELQSFFNKVKSRPDLFELLEESLWRVVEI